VLGQAVEDDDAVRDALHPAPVPERRVAVVGVQVVDRCEHAGLLEVGVETVLPDLVGLRGQVHLRLEQGVDLQGLEDGRQEREVVAVDVAREEGVHELLVAGRVGRLLDDVAPEPPEVVPEAGLQEVVQEHERDEVVRYLDFGVYYQVIEPDALNTHTV